MVFKLKELKNNQGFMKYFKNTSWLFMEKILRIIVGLFIGIWLARYLGPEQFGLFSYAQTLVSLVAIIASFGLDNIVVRELVKNQKNQDSILGTAFALKFIGSIITFIVIFFLTKFMDYDGLTNLLLLIIASSTIFTTLQVIDFYFQAKVLSKYSVYANIGSIFLSMIFKILLLVFEAPLLYFAVAIFIENLLLAIFYLYYYYQNKLSIKKWNINIEILKNLFHDSWPFILSAFAVAIYMKIDVIMIKEILGNNEVGQYAIAVRLSEVWNFIPVIICASIFPAIINVKNDKILYKKRLENLYSLMIWIAVIIAIVISFFSEFIIVLLFGEVYKEASAVLQVHVWSTIFIFLLVASGKWLVSENYGKHALYRNISGAIINIFLNYLLIPIYGILGAAYATLISYAVAALFYDLVDRKLRESFIMKINAIFFINLFKTQ